ncbi:MAG: TadE family protein [Candidatus Ozemobacteraceae bacterium]
MKSLSHHGQAMVEFALVLPILLLVFLGIVDFAITMHTWSSLNQQCIQAARVGSKRIHQMVARNVQASTTHVSLDAVQSVFWGECSPLMAPENYANVAFEGVGTDTAVVRVSADYSTVTLNPLLTSFFGRTSEQGKLMLHASAEERKE